MGRSGGGGGGHSSGGSHSHSSSHSHGSSHSHSSGGRGSSFSSHSGGGSYYSGYHHSYSHCGPGGPYIPDSGPRRYRSYSTPITIFSFSRFITILIILFVILVFTSRIGVSNSSNITASTIQRERVDTKNAYINDCVIDEIGWIDNENKVASELKEFYEDTGCQPYIYLKTYDSSMTTVEARESWSQNYYDSHFAENQNVVLYVYFCDKDDKGYGDDTLFVGTESSIVMDSEAQEIFWNYLDYDWDNWDVNDNDGMFVDVFTKTGDRIMSVTSTANDVKKAAIIGIVIVLVVAGVIIIISKKYKREKEKAQETIDILNAPLDAVRDPAEDLADKYNGV